MTYFAAHTLGLALLLLLFQTTGMLVERAVPALAGVGVRTGLVRITLGICTWMYLLMALAAVGLLRRPVMLGAGTLVLITAGTLALRSPAHWRAHDIEPAPESSWSAVTYVPAWVGPAAVLLALFVLALGPWPAWDDMTYHLTLPKLYLQHGGFRRVAFNVYSNWPLNVELLYALAMAVQDYVTAKLLDTAFLALLALAVYRVAMRAAAPWAAIVAVALLLANDVVLVGAPTASVDIPLAFFFFMAVTLALEHRETGEPLPLIVSGIFCGCAAGIKVSGFAVVACVAPIVAAGTVMRHREGRLRSLARDAVLLGAPVVALALPWIIKSFVYTGNPLYPLFWDSLGGVEWSSSLQDQFMRWQQSIGMGRSPRDYLLLPVRVILQGGGDYAHFAAWIGKTWIVFVPMAVVCSPFVPLARRCLLPAAIYFVIWALMSQQTRFLIAILPLLAVAAAVTMHWIVRRAARMAGAVAPPDLTDVRVRRFARGLAAATVAGALVILGWASRYVLPAAIASARDLVARPPVLHDWVPNPVYSFIRNNLPPSAKLMLLDTSFGLFVDREYVADSFFEASQMNALIGAAEGRDGLTAMFEGLGITHVLVDRATWNVPFPQALWEYLDGPDTARRIYVSPDGSITVYELLAIAPHAALSPLTLRNWS